MGEREDLLDHLGERARFFSSLTTIGVPIEATQPEQMSAASTRSPESSAPCASQSQAEDAISQSLEDPAAGLAKLRAWIGDCQRCKLASGRKNIVFGQGNPGARLMFVGEAPGAEEDEQGLAFVGKAGQLLTRIIEAISMKRADVFIANVLKCRPPNNRNPETDEILACQTFLEKQIDCIRPKVLVGLGKFSGQWLLKTSEPISRIRGRLGSFQGIAVMPTYHPAYLLRNPGAKKEVWEDMKVVRSLLEA